MKQCRWKGISLLIVLSMLLSVMPGAQMVSAAEVTPAEDSANVSEELRELLLAPPDGMVVRMYNMHIVSAFGTFDNIEDVLSSSFQTIYYLEMWDGSGREKMMLDGELIELTKVAESSKALEVYKSGSMIDLLGEDTVVKNVYYLTGEAADDGTAIYYRTNKGDYVYYIQWELGECFFPADAFFETMDGILAEITQYSHLYLDGEVDVSDVVDISAYRLDSATFFLNPSAGDSTPFGGYWFWVGILVAAVVAVSVGAVVVIKTKKKKI